jgi:hypothetical protein
MSFSSSSSRVLLKVSQVPDWERRAIRLSLGLVFFTSLGLTLWAVPGEQQQQQQQQQVAWCSFIASASLYADALAASAWLVVHHMHSSISRCSDMITGQSREQL